MRPRAEWLELLEQYLNWRASDLADWAYDDREHRRDRSPTRTWRTHCSSAELTAQPSPGDLHWAHARWVYIAVCSGTYLAKPSRELEPPRVSDAVRAWHLARHDERVKRRATRRARRRGRAAAHFKIFRVRRLVAGQLAQLSPEARARATETVRRMLESTALAALKLEP